MKSFLALFIALLSLTVIAEEAVDIKPAELLQADTSEWLIIDVRSAEEYAEGHVPGAINIPHTDMAAQMSTIQTYKDKPVVVYCRSGYRAGKAADVLIEADFSDVRHLEGDIMGWRNAGHELEQ
ncbi:rhodanese-like domain-containing protein [Alteromonas sp. ASW11-36]|uniref:Rhodanese-like domain-containing protein n=1 Tax=Alteromonas arenosi TaxID=3055817 RepID=A0ABT7T045_9ALTE|nr:rhodanese-like domain-containing protein [Alteromonas sp. ASW11-36]MDM7861798.1 rhodanese-like domain-containing protein [Alteromonas sp. ASW11-36]